MASVAKIIHTFVNCGEYQPRRTTQLNERSSLDDIHREVRHLCVDHLPQSFSVQYYSMRARKFITIDQDQLQGEYNPFRWKPYLGDPTDSVPNISLYIVDETNDGFENLHVEQRESTIYEQLLTTLNERIASMRALNSLPVTTNNKDHVIDSSGSPSEKVLINDDSDELEEFLCETSFIESSSVIDEFFTSSDSDILTEAILNESSFPVEDAVPTVHQQLTISPPTIELDKHSDRFYLSLDVKPQQKKIYKSDKYNQKNGTKVNGGITRIQGMKSEARKMTSVWPRVRIPERFRNELNLQLDVYVVTEQLRDNQRVWSKHRDKGFLPKGFTRDTPPINPITFELNRNNLTNEGDFELELSMVSLWNKDILETVEQLYELDEQSTLQLHQAVHEPSAPRLLCVLKKAERNDGSVMCLSDFMRSPGKKVKRNLSSNARPNEVACKRMRTA